MKIELRRSNDRRRLLGRSHCKSMLPYRSEKDAYRNAGWRELYDGFVPDARIRKQIWKGLRRWLQCELFNLKLVLTSRTTVPADHASTAAPEAVEV